MKVKPNTRTLAYGQNLIRVISSASIVLKVQNGYMMIQRGMMLEKFTFQTVAIQRLVECMLYSTVVGVQLTKLLTLQSIMSSLQIITLS